MHHPKPLWFKCLERLAPNRCREIPEARDPSRILLRQFAIIKERAYLQQFASGEDPDWYHTHPWRYGTIALGLRGAVTDHNYSGAWREKRVKAPYVRFMGPNTTHRTSQPTPTHTSIFIGIGKKTDEKFYYPGYSTELGKRHWREHIKCIVKRL